MDRPSLEQIDAELLALGKSDADIEAVLARYRGGSSTPLEELDQRLEALARGLSNLEDILGRMRGEEAPGRAAETAPAVTEGAGAGLSEPAPADSSFSRMQELFNEALSTAPGPPDEAAVASAEVSFDSMEIPVDEGSGMGDLADLLEGDEGDFVEAVAGERTSIVGPDEVASMGSQGEITDPAASFDPDQLFEVPSGEFEFLAEEELLELEDAELAAVPAATSSAVPPPTPSQVPAPTSAAPPGTPSHAPESSSVAPPPTSAEDLEGGEDEGDGDGEGKKGFFKKLFG